MSSIRSVKSDLDSQILEDVPTSLDVMWASSQTGCGPLKRLLMEVEPMRQSTQATADSKQSFGLGRTKKTNSASAIFVPSRPSTSAGHCNDQLQLRPMKRIRSGPHVFAKESPTPSHDDKTRQNQSFDLLGGGKFATERLARVSRSLNQKAISEYSNSQKPKAGQQSSIIGKRRTQPLQAQSNIIHNRNYNVPSKSAMIGQASNGDLKAESTPNGSNKLALTKPSTNLKDSPKKGRLKALLKTIDHDSISSSSGPDHHRTVLPVRNSLSSHERLEGLPKGRSIGIGQASCSVNDNASERQQITSSSSSNLASVISRRTSREAGFDVQHTNAKTMAKPRKNPISPPPRLQPKRTYRGISQDAKVNSMSLCLSDDDEKLRPVFNGLTSTVETPVDSTNSVGEGDDSLYNDANSSSSSYGDIDIDLSLLENVCKKYDT